MKNKVLVQVLIPNMEISYDVYIPINRKIGNIIGLLNKSIYEMTNGMYEGNDSTALYDYNTGDIYPMDTILKNTNIRNGSKVILM